MSEPEDFDLDEAYAVETLQDNIELYARWASTYETFVERNGYQHPLMVAAKLLAWGGRDHQPVLDVGCGTGLGGQALVAEGPILVDGLDLSAEMIAEAAQKQDPQGQPVYRAFHQANLKETLPIEDGFYGAVMSAGTFTHGHVGPEAFDELYRITRPGALFVVGINKEFYAEQGFAQRFSNDAKDGQISEPMVDSSSVYSRGEHKGHHGLILTFSRQ
ncbi:MAG: methyltransferase domain-containing protein [Acidimicrobiales bacterium]|nr:methyltransferase domain-containing protein [Acidimicrobiales bacterium]